YARTRSTALIVGPAPGCPPPGKGCPPPGFGGNGWPPPGDGGIFPGESGPLPRDGGAPPRFRGARGTPPRGRRPTARVGRAARPGLTLELQGLQEVVRVRRVGELLRPFDQDDVHAVADQVNAAAHFSLVGELHRVIAPRVAAQRDLFLTGEFGS